METGVEQVCVIVAAMASIFAIDGIPRYLGVRRRGFLHLYRDRSADRWTRLLPVASVYIAVALYAVVVLMITSSLWDNDTAATALGILLLVCVLAAVVALARGPRFLLPPWAARMAARNWAGYWGDEADAEVQPDLWADASVLTIGAAAAVAWVLISPGLEKIWPLGLGIAAGARLATGSRG